MGIIPRAQENVRMNVSSPVPIRGASTEGVAEMASAGLGQDLQKLGGVILQHYDQQEELKQQNALEISSNQLESLYRQSMEVAEKEAASDGSDIGKKFNDHFNPAASEIIKNGPGEKKYADRLQVFEQKVRTQADTNLFIQSGVLLEKHNSDQATVIGNTFANSVREHPEPAMVASRIQNYETYLGGIKGISPKENAKLMNNFMGDIGISFVQGLIEKGQPGAALNYLRANQPNEADGKPISIKLDPNEAQKLGFIHAGEKDALLEQGKTYDIPALTKGDGARLTPQLTAAMNAIDPQKKFQYIEHVKNKAEGEAAARLSELSHQVTAAKYLAERGELGSNDEAQIAYLKKQINMNPYATPASKLRLMDDLNTAAALGDQTKSMMSKPRSQWASAVESFDQRIKAGEESAAKFDPRMKDASSDLSVQANRLQAKEKVKAFQVHLAAAQKADASSFVLNSNDKVKTLFEGIKDGDSFGSQNFARASLAEQSRLEIPEVDQRVLPKPMAVGIGQLLKNIPSSAETNEKLTQLQAQWGPQFPRILHEISKADKDLEAYKAAMYSPKETRGVLVDAIKNATAINKGFSGLENHTTIKNTLEDSVAAEMKPFASAVAGSANDSSRQSLLNGFSEAVSLEAKSLILHKGMDPSVAAKKAYNDVIGAQYSVVNAGQSSLVVPRVIDNQAILPEKVKGFVQYHSIKDGLKNLGAMVPSDATGKYQDPDKFYQDLQATGRWVPNENQDGIRLMTVEMDGTLNPIYNKYGVVIEKKFKDINNDPNEYGLKARQRYLNPGAP